MASPQTPSHLESYYRSTSGAVAYIDETFQLPNPQFKTFYIMVASVVRREYMDESRDALADFYGGHPMHASEMYKELQMESLRRGLDIVSKNYDACRIVVRTEVDDDDTFGDRARIACLEHLFVALHTEERVDLFVLDSRGKADADEVDETVLHQLRSDGKVDRNCSLVHCRPSEELLIGLADLVAWSYRQEHARNDSTWFDSVRDGTKTVVLKSATTIVASGMILPSQMPARRFSAARPLLR